VHVPSTLKLASVSCGAIALDVVRVLAAARQWSRDGDAPVNLSSAGEV
jgi:hypothetical protein